MTASLYSVHTVTSEDAHAAATRDRAATAELILGVARGDVIRILAAEFPPRVYRVARADLRWQRAVQSAARILGASS